MPTVWAYSKAAPGKTCEDARLLGGGTNIQYPAGNDQGQGGWEIGLMFETFSDLATKLKALQENITRLAINLHGAPGVIDALSDGSGMDFAKLWARFSNELTSINQKLSAGAIVLIMGCNVALGKEGDNFLTQLSDKAFRGHKVVGFTTIGETMRQYRRGESCSEAGMRDSPYGSPSENQPTVQAEREKEVLTLPWASESSPHAKIALDRKIVLTHETPIPSQDYSPNNYLPGTWSVSIGSWQGYFIFTGDSHVKWSAQTKTNGGGNWSADSNGVTWTFVDDDPKFTRTFRVTVRLQTTVNGDITISGRNSGFFTMSKQ
ncbi:MAG TPA: DUF4347 domain-containing protein [Bryobacteraceae bacterium]|jgi:hypothetical protein